MTNREWLNSLSNENFIKWLSESTGIESWGGEIPKLTEYWPTKYIICMSSNNSERALKEWLEEERPDYYGENN